MLAHWWKCCGSLVDIWWLIGGVLVAHYRRCDGSLVDMWWLICQDVVARWWTLGWSVEIFFKNTDLNNICVPIVLKAKAEKNVENKIG